VNRLDHSWQPTADQRAAYVHFRRFLFGPLAILSRQGFLLPPVESVDLIQSFFEDAWRDVTTSYDPRHSQFDEYVCKSFVHFARPRIVCMLRWRMVLTTNLFSIGTFDDKFVSFDRSLNQEFRSSLLSLSLIERELLVHHLVFSSRREKRFAERHHLSLYHLREKLVETLGFLAKIIGQIDIFPNNERRVVLAMWKESRTKEETADVLALPTSDVEMAHKHILIFVRQNLHQDHDVFADWLQEDNPR
jgi:hypothetical protein